ncbi:murein DD-endopeptidase MepM/ murein hydrolase activator NlpD [Epilithonimonas hungarica]|uniref:M23 family metallopeptidase n=1 Tax=Epilithonimonas hungarica TaxID=454006 RepID=UPI002785DFB7|nr:M23 family metallopeptidase [Epilithonimonas hungarica]MDP9954994.1 murein DD-endopeptidase MepM/ murein hydrolase activator NlpD [Epilithonimonas hungarica]
MKTLKTYFLIGLLLSFHCLVYGQFNTLTPTQPKKTENPPEVSKAEETKDLKQKSHKKFRKNIFSTISKAHLKKKLDSLKTMIKENTEYDIEKWNRQNVKDSLIFQLHSKVIDEQKGNRPLTKNGLENKIEDITLPKIAMPLNRGISVTSSYGRRIHPIFGKSKIHNGIDLKAYFENVYAVMDGMVSATGWDSKGGGNYIKVKHYNRYETAYLHLSEIYYKVGELVKAGYVIAKSGNSGNSTGAHLHFAVRENGKYIDPVHFLNDLIVADHWLVTSYQN